MLGQKKKCGPKILFIQKYCGPQQILGQKEKKGLKKVLFPKKMLGPKNVLRVQFW